MEHMYKDRRLDQSADMAAATSDSMHACFAYIPHFLPILPHFKSN
jgi:hypothetical protein